MVDPRYQRILDSVDNPLLKNCRIEVPESYENKITRLHGDDFTLYLTTAPSHMCLFVRGNVHRTIIAYYNSEIMTYGIDRTATVKLPYNITEPEFFQKSILNDFGQVTYEHIDLLREILLLNQ